MRDALCLILLFGISAVTAKKYTPSWDSLDTRPLPKWFDEAKIGIFLHWGVFSVPASGEWFWNYWSNNNSAAAHYMKKYYPPDFTYADFGPQFRAERYNPNELAEIFQAAGAQLIFVNIICFKIILKC